jgi:hypothetical protein
MAAEEGPIDAHLPDTHGGSRSESGGIGFSRLFRWFRLFTRSSCHLASSGQSADLQFDDSVGVE